jgi:hypothetical protein
MRKFMASLGFIGVGSPLARLAFAPLFLAERPDGATGLLLGAGRFTIAIASAARKSAGAAVAPAFFYGVRRAS